MNIEKLIVGQLQTNCYLVWDNESKETIVIDPGDEGDFIIQKILQLGLKPLFIIATHGHFDHVLAVLELKLALSIPFLINKKDSFLLRRSQDSAIHFTGLPADPVPNADKFLKEGDKIKFGTESLKVIETPGHTPGGISLYSSGILFSGDTLFANGVGRTDLLYSSEKDLNNSLQKIFHLPDDTIVYPGHGLATSIKTEKQAKIC